jgi:hypothetical protein
MVKENDDSISEDEVVVLDDKEIKIDEKKSRIREKLQGGEVGNQTKGPRRKNLERVRTKHATTMSRRLGLQQSVLQGQEAPARLQKKQSKNWRRKLATTLQKTKLSFSMMTMSLRKTKRMNRSTKKRRQSEAESQARRQSCRSHQPKVGPQSTLI